MHDYPRYAGGLRSVFVLQDADATLYAGRRKNCTPISEKRFQFQPNIKKLPYSHSMVLGGFEEMS